MKREELNQKVNEELRHIPRIKGYPNQNYFRVYYNGMRRHDLAMNPATPASQSFKRALEHFRQKNPDFSSTYDRDFFQI